MVSTDPPSESTTANASKEARVPLTGENQPSFLSSITQLPKTLIAFLGALAAAVVPLTEAIQGYWQNELKARELEHKIVLDFVDRATSSKLDLQERKRILGVLLALKDNPLREWATGQIKIVDNKIKTALKQQEEFKNRLSSMDKSSEEYFAQSVKVESIESEIKFFLTAGKTEQAATLQLTYVEEQVKLSRMKESLTEASAQVTKIKAHLGRAESAEILAKVLNEPAILTKIEGRTRERQSELEPLVEKRSSPDVFSRLDVSVVSKLFPDTPVEIIRANLPSLKGALVEYNLTDKAMVLTALATIRTETERFEPLAETASRFNTSPNGHPLDLYDNRRDLGNKGPPDGYTFRGRGYVQLTGRFNYEKFGQAIGLGQQLVENPDLANAPAIASKILAYFIKSVEPALRQAIANEDYARARRILNGGSHGIDRFIQTFSLGSQLLT